MRLLALGTGTCNGAPPGQRLRMPPLFALDVAGDGDAPAWIVFECSEGARWRLTDAGVDAALVAHVAVSHGHPDHAALPQFAQSRACEAIFGDRPRSPTLSVYLPPLAAATLSSLWAWHQPEDGGRPSTRIGLRVVPTWDGWSGAVMPGVTLRAFAVKHGRTPAVAFRVEARGQVFAYSGDAGPCDGLARAAEGADLFVCEAAARVGQDMSTTYGHCNPRQAGAVARAAGAARLWLTHYSGHDGHDAMLADARASGYAGDVRVAGDGDDVRW